MTQSSSARATTLLALLFILGLAVTLFAFVDLQWTHWLFVRAVHP